MTCLHAHTRRLTGYVLSSASHWFPVEATRGMSYEEFRESVSAQVADVCAGGVVESVPSCEWPQGLVLATTAGSVPCSPGGGSMLLTRAGWTRFKNTLFVDEHAGAEVPVSIKVWISTTKPM